jgi:hypothetical protein
MAEVGGLGLSLCADLLEELKATQSASSSSSGTAPAAAATEEEEAEKKAAAGGGGGGGGGGGASDAATEAALRRHEVFERHRVSAELFNTDAALGEQRNANLLSVFFSLACLVKAIDDVPSQARDRQALVKAQIQNQTKRPVVLRVTFR